MGVYTTCLTIILHKAGHPIFKLQGVEDFPFNPCYATKNTLITLPIGGKKITFTKLEAGWTKRDKVSYSMTVQYIAKGFDTLQGIARMLKIVGYEEI